jgi:DNA replication protein DnaC
MRVPRPDKAGAGEADRDELARALPRRGRGRPEDANLAAGKGLWFTGGNGTYKTVTAAAVLKRAAEEGYSVVYKSVPNLLSTIRGTYNDESAMGYLEFKERLQQVDLLLLDDLGAEMMTDWVLEQLFVLVDDRMIHRRAVIVTTNQSIPGSAEYLERLRPRLRRRFCGSRS